MGHKKGEDVTSKRIREETDEGTGAWAKEGDPRRTAEP